MTSLANNAVAQIFAIPASDWTVINTRVGEVLAASKIQSYITPYLAGYPALLTSSLLWKSDTFYGLIHMSASLASYASTAINNFDNLNQAVKKLINNGLSMTDAVRLQTTTVLKQLADDTKSMSVQSDTLSDQVLHFLNNNEVVDAQIIKNKDKLGSFWAPLGAYITALEQAAGVVTGEWRAISDDLDSVMATTIDVTIPFIESLNIDAAIACWQSLQQEASAFPTMMAGQDKYWTITT